MSKSNKITSLRSRLQRKYPSMSPEALNSAVKAAQITLDGGAGPRNVKATSKAAEKLTGDTNRLSGRADDGRRR